MTYHGSNNDRTRDSHAGLCIAQVLQYNLDKKAHKDCAQALVSMSFCIFDSWLSVTSITGCKVV